MSVHSVSVHYSKGSYGLVSVCNELISIYLVRRNTTIVGDSNKSEWMYIVKSVCNLKITLGTNGSDRN